MICKFLTFALFVTFGLLSVACDPSDANTLDVTLRAYDVGFDTQTINVKANQSVKLRFMNTGALDHAFAAEGLVKELKVRPGQTVTLTFTPKTEGEYKFYCPLMGHETLGMVGKLAVAR